MKKFIAVVMSVVMVALACLSVGAENVISPKPPVTTTPDPAGAIIITPWDEIGEANPEVDTENFENAYNELDNTDDLSDLVDGVEDDSVVRDLFDITVTGNEKDKLEEEGKLTVTIPAEMTDDDFQLIFRGEDGWSHITDYILNSDGSITITITEMGIVAILVTEAAEGTNPPQTSDPMLVILAVMAVAGAAVAVTVAKKRKA